MTRRLRPLLILLAAIGLTWLIYHELRDGPQWDAYLLTLVGLALALSVGLMLLATERWSGQALGFLAVIGALAALELLQVALFWGWLDRPGRATVDLIRSALAVGSLLLLVSVARLAWLARFAVRGWFDHPDDADGRR